jgi:hypothetical protein
MNLLGVRSGRHGILADGLSGEIHGQQGDAGYGSEPEMGGVQKTAQSTSSNGAIGLSRQFSAGSGPNCAAYLALHRFIAEGSQASRLRRLFNSVEFYCRKAQVRNAGW